MHTSYGAKAQKKWREVKSVGKGIWKKEQCISITRFRNIKKEAKRTGFSWFQFRNKIRTFRSKKNLGGNPDEKSFESISGSNPLNISCHSSEMQLPCTRVRFCKGENDPGWASHVQLNDHWKYSIKMPKLFWNKNMHAASQKGLSLFMGSAMTDSVILNRVIPFKVHWQWREFRRV